MNNPSLYPDSQHDEVNTLHQRLLELEGSNHQYQRKVEQLSQQLAQERIARQQAEERLKVVNERFQFAAKAVNCVIYDWNLTSDRIERTDGLTRLLGYSLDETEPTGKWWCDRIHPEDLRSILKQALSALTKEDYFAVEYRVLNQSNEYVYVLDQGIVIDRDADGSPTRVVGSTTNISDRKQVEDELRESEQRLQLAQQVGRIGTWEWNPVTDEVSWSDGIWTLLALEPNSITPSRKAFIRFIHPDDREQALRGIKVALSQGDFYTDEFRVIRQDGAVCWFLSKGQVIRTPDGQPERILGINVDITDRKQVEADLAKSNQTLQAIVKACPLAIMGLRSDGTVRIWNPAAERIFGWSQQEVLGKFLPAIPDHKRNEFLNNLTSTLRGQGLAGVEAQRQKKGNILFDVELWTAPVDEMQAEISCLSVVADISDRKRAEEQRKQAERALLRSEEQLRLAQQAAAAGLWDWDIAANQVTWSEEYYQLYGLETTVTPSYENWLGAILEQDREVVDKAAREALEHRTNLNVEFRILHPTKGICWLTAIGQTFYDEQQQPKRMTGIALDITQRKQAEAAKEQFLARERAAREEAEQANRIKDEFLAVLSHELRTPLNPILGWTKLLQTGSFDAQRTKQALEVIERNIKQQTQLIDDLLDISRILRGKLVLNEAPVNLVFTIEAALETVRLAAEAKNIQIETDLDPFLPPVLGDEGRLQQIVLNLLSNAIKFTPYGGQVEVRLKRVEPEVYIQVKDTGKGIAPDFLPYVFELFRQEDSRTTRRFGGLGLGLAIVRQMTELHGGTAHAESMGEGLGATFTIRLPLMQSQELDCEKIPSLGALSNESGVLQGVRVLVVDDEADMRELIAIILEQAGAIAQTAASATEALVTFAQFQPTLLISDIGMPDINGYMLMQQIRSQPSQQGGLIPAIALTAYAGEYDQQQALKVGFQQHIAKPVEPEELVKAIINLVRPIASCG